LVIMSRMPKNDITLVEIAVVALVSAVSCVLFYTPVWAAGMNLLQAVVNDIGGYSSCYPFWELARRVYFDGFFPIWVDEVELGVALISVWISTDLFPLKLLTLPFEFDDIANIYLISRIWLMAFFAYVFARRSMGMGRSGSALTAVAFAFSGMAQKRMMTAEMNVPWLIPLFLLTLREALIKPRLLTGMGLISLLLSVPQFIPGLETLLWDWNYHFKSPTGTGYPVEGIFSLALPWLVGANKSNLAVTQLAPYLGAVPFLLAVFGLAVLRRLGRYGPFFAAYGIVFLGLSYTLPFFSTLGHVPPLDRLLNNVSAYPSLTLAAAVVAGAVFDLVIKDANESRILLKWALGAAAVTLAAGAYAWWLIENLRSDPLTAIFFTDPTAAYQSLKSQLLFGCVIFLALAAVIAWLPRRKIAATTCVVLLTFFGLFVDALGWNHENPGLIERLNSSSAARYVLDNSHPGTRIISECEFMEPNLYLLAGLRHFSFVIPFQPKRYMNLILKLNRLDLQRTEDIEKLKRMYENKFYLPFPMEYFGTPLSDLLGVQFSVVCGKPFPQGSDLVFASDAAVYESASVVPQAFLTGRWWIMGNEEAALDAMLNLKRGDERVAMFVAGDPGVADTKFPKNFDGHAGTVREVYHNRQKLELEISAVKGSVLVLRGLYRPGWKARLDGVEVRILPADYFFRGVPVPAGDHEVVFTYAPPSFGMAVWSLLATLACVLLIATVRLTSKHQ